MTEIVVSYTVVTKIVSSEPRFLLITRSTSVRTENWSVFSLLELLITLLTCLVTNVIGFGVNLFVFFESVGSFRRPHESVLLLQILVSSLTLATSVGLALDFLRSTDHLNSV